MRKILIFIAFLTFSALMSEVNAKVQNEIQAQDSLHIPPWMELIQKEYLPSEAQEFIDQYLRGWKMQQIVKRCELDYVKDHYTITFKGERVAEFDDLGAVLVLNGNGKEIPLGFLPTQMLNYLRENFLRQKVVYVRFEKRAGEWEAHLDDGSMARFDILGFMVRVER